MNKDILFSTRNSAQYFVITYMVKESELDIMCVYVQIYVHVCVKQNSAIYLKLTQHYKSIILQYKIKIII